MTYEWVLIIWTITCGWDCHRDNVREFGAYPTETECIVAKKDWIGDSGWITAKCMKRPKK